MKILSAISLNDFQLLVADMTEAVDVLIGELENFPTYASEYARISTDKRRREFICARILVNQILERPVRIKYDEAGKPFIENHAGHISISHSGPYLALIYHPIQAVGVDIESPTGRVLKVSSRFLHAAELADFSNDLLKIQLAWSAKEALYKIVGARAVDFSESMRLHNFEPADSGIVYCELIEEQIIYSLHYIVKAEYNLVYLISG